MRSSDSGGRSLSPAELANLLKAMLALVERLLNGDSESLSTVSDAQRHYSRKTADALQILAICLERSRSSQAEPGPEPDPDLVSDPDSVPVPVSGPGPNFDRQSTAGNAPSELVESLRQSLEAAGLKLCRLSSITLGAVYEQLLNFSPYYDSEENAWQVMPIAKARKRGGNFFTPIELAELTVKRALDPLVYTDGHPGIKSPEEILSLKIIDPSMGAAFFLVAALDRLAELTLESLSRHDRVLAGEKEWSVTLHLSSRLQGAMVSLPVQCEMLRTQKRDADCFTFSAETAGSARQALFSWLKRLILAGSIYGVDKDAGAVTAARLVLSLSARIPVATSPRWQPLSDNLRRGNSLIGYRWHSHSNGNVDRLSGDQAAISQEELDRLTAAWFWPADRPPSILQPQGRPLLPEQRDLIACLKEKHQFFHWNLAFKEVFEPSNPGFDAVIGNPPWEIEKPNSREFFERFDPDFFEYGKQEALARQRRLLSENPQILSDWQAYQSEICCFNNFVRGARFARDCLSAFVRPGAEIAGSDNESALFAHQGGGDLNAYKLFVELAYHIVRDGGVVAQVVPAGLYSDKGAGSLRHLLMSECRWLSIDGFSNSKGLFSIHRSFKFCVFVAMKGGSTDAIECRFMLRTAGEAGRVPPVEQTRKLINTLSPRWRTLFEVTSRRELEILERIQANSVALGKSADHGWDLHFERQLDMTTDSSRFHLRDELEGAGFQCDQYGHWLEGGWQSAETLPLFEERTGSEISSASDLIFSRDRRSYIEICDVRAAALPLYEGRMVGQFDASEKGWVKGKGRRAEWVKSPSPDLAPQYLVMAGDFPEYSWFDSLKVGFLAVGSPTNARTMIAACLNGFPCGNSVPVFKTASCREALCLAVSFNSFVFDFHLRCRMSGNNLNYFLIEECPLLPLSLLGGSGPLIACAAALSLDHQRFALAWRQLINEGQPSERSVQAHMTEIDQSIDPFASIQGWRHRAQRLRLRCIVDAVIAYLHGLDQADLAYILDCEQSDSERVSDKGFWRVDKEMPVRKRKTYLTLQAFLDLQERGLAEFWSQNEGGGWQPPLAVFGETGNASSVDRLDYGQAEFATSLPLHCRRLEKLRKLLRGQFA